MMETHRALVNKGAFYGRGLLVFVCTLLMPIFMTNNAKLLAQSEKSYPLDEIENPIGLRFGYNNSSLKGKDFKNTKSRNGFDFGVCLLTRPDEFSVIETGLTLSFRGYRVFNSDTIIAPTAIQVPQISGSTRLYMLDFPFMTYIRLTRNLKLLAGGNLSLKYLSQQRLRGNVTIISSDSTFVIPFRLDANNNAIDLLDLSLTGGLAYHVSDRLEFRAQGHIDLLGLNTAEYGGFSRTNNQQWFTVSLVYWLGEFMDLF